MWLFLSDYVCVTLFSVYRNISSLDPTWQMTKKQNKTFLFTYKKKKILYPSCVFVIYIVYTQYDLLGEDCLKLLLHFNETFIDHSMAFLNKMHSLRPPFQLNAETSFDLII